MEPDVLYSEPGARWRSIAYGPVFCLAILAFEIVAGVQVHWFALTAFAVLLAGFVALQVFAGKRHVSVELTPESLRQGTEVVPLSSIRDVLPPLDDHRRREASWESAPSLGELSNVPRGRTPIGLKLDGDRVVRAWARDDERLRSALLDALERRRRA